MSDAHKNFAYSTVAVAPVPDTSGTALTVQTGDGALFPATSFNAVVWPAETQPTTANAEVVRVTNITTDVFTITRTQESSSARAIVTGDQIGANITAKTLTDVEAVANAAYTPGGTDVAVADGGTGSSTASNARTALGLAIGTDVQAHDSDLDTIAGLTATTDNFMVANSSAWASRTPSQARTHMGLGSIAVLAAPSGTVVGTTDTQTLSAKTLDTPVIRNWDGWEDANETWTYASGATTNVGTFTIAGVDLTTKYQAGDRVKFTQTTVKYALIVKTAFSTDTTISIYMGTDYTIANAAISANYYSKGKSPQGFPLDPVKWTESVTGSHALSNPGGLSTVINFNSVSLSVPIGTWSLKCNGLIQVSTTSSGNTYVDGGLSTANNSESDAELVGAGANKASTTGTNVYPLFVEKRITVTSATPYYLVVEAQAGSGTVTVGITPYYIKAVSALL